MHLISSLSFNNNLNACIKECVQAFLLAINVNKSSVLVYVNYVLCCLLIRYELPYVIMINQLIQQYLTTLNMS